MALHPQVVKFLEARKAAALTIENPTLEQMRADPWNWLDVAGPLATDVDTRHTYVTSPTADLHTVIYTPKNVKPGAPALVYFHGGGWVFSWVLRYAPQLSNIASESGAVVIGINYQKAPEHQFPIPFDDCYAGLLWVRDHATELGIDPKKIGVGGDSAGGNLAAAVALKAGHTGDVALAYQALIYPCVDTDYTRESYRDHETGYGLEAVGMKWCWDAYIPEAERANQYAVPMKADRFNGVAPAFVALAEHDILRDEGVAYGEKLANAGISVTIKEWPGMVHGFFGHGRYVDAAYEIRSWISAQIVSHTQG